MRSSVDKDKKMVTNIKKRKSSISQTEPKAKSPKKEPAAGSPGSSPKGKAKLTKAQTPKAKTPAVAKKQVKAQPASPVVTRKAKTSAAAKKQIEAEPASPTAPPKAQTPAVSKKQIKAEQASAIVTQSKPKRGKQNGNENAIQSKFEKKTLVKNVVKKNIKPVVVQQGKEKKEKAAPSRRRAMMKEKFNDLRERIQKGDIAAIREVEEVMKKIIDRGEFSRASKRKLRAYRTLLSKATNAPPAKTRKGKKTVKKNK